jgi:DNA polymerase III gamma/tau subunit
MTVANTLTYDHVLTIVRQLPREDRRRLVQQLSSDEDQYLEEACQKALALGQDPSIVQQVRAKQMHILMLNFGLLKDDEYFAHFTEEIYRQRQNPSSRPEVSFEDS